MDKLTDTVALAQKQAERRERELAKHRRYYAAHRDMLRQKAHERYFLQVHNTLNPPPLRSNMKVGQ